MNINGVQGEDVERSFRIDPVQPSKVTDIAHNSSSILGPTPQTRLDVRWGIPLHGMKCVTGYEIIMWRRDRNETEEPNIINETITSLSISRTDLIACEVYKFRVTPIHNSTVRGETEEIVMSMQPRVAPDPAQPVRDTYGPNFLNLYTVNKDVKSVCYPSIALFTCLYEGEGPTYVESVRILNCKKPKKFQLIEISSHFRKSSKKY